LGGAEWLKNSFSIWRDMPRDGDRKSHPASFPVSLVKRILDCYAYDNQCCLCSDSLVDLSGVYETEAAHIVPKRLHGSDDVRNGLALCRKHHWAYDRGLFGINSDYSVVVPDKVSAISDNKSLARCHRSLMKVPKSAPAPDISALEWHLEHILSDNL